MTVVNICDVVIPSIKILVAHKIGKTFFRERAAKQKPTLSFISFEMSDTRVVY